MERSRRRALCENNIWGMSICEDIKLMGRVERRATPVENEVGGGGSRTHGAAKVFSVEDAG